MERAVAHDAVLRGAIAECGGVTYKRIGDAVFAAAWDAGRSCSLEETIAEALALAGLLTVSSPPVFPRTVAKHNYCGAGDTPLFNAPAVPGCGSQP